MKSLTYIEIDVPYCALTYGTSPCTASIPTTGADRCHNTRKTCQDPTNIDLSDVTLRFAVDTDYLPKNIEAIPCVVSVDYDGATISLGQDLGLRATLNVSFREFRHSDAGAGLDKYAALRSYDPYTRGTFWSKFRARQPYLHGQPIRLIRGLVGQSLGGMETRHFVIEHFQGPSIDGTYTIIAKDVLKLADNDRAKAPFMNNGVLDATLTDVATSATLSPTGIGNLEYAASGYVAIGGKEVCAFTRSGDVLTLTRAQYSTVAVAHAQEDRVQQLLIYTGENPATIISDLLQTYAGVPASYIADADWQAEVDTYLQRVYTGVIAEPTGVSALISELIEQAALALWWDDRSQQMRLRVLRPILDASTFDDGNTLEGSFTSREQPEQRLSEVWVYYGQRNPLEPLDRLDNYRSIEVTIDPQAEANYGSPAVKTITSRWIAAFGRTSASRVGALLLARYRDPPRLFSFEVWRSDSGLEDVQLGAGYNLGAWCIQDESGAAALVPVQITSLRPGPDRYIAQAEEMVFSYTAESGGGGVIGAEDPDEHVIVIDTDAFNVNLRTVHDSLYEPVPADAGDITVTVYINSGVKVGSSSPLDFALSVGTWADPDVPITIINNGRIQGAGGKGGRRAVGVNINPVAGGPAIYTRKTVTIENNGTIYGGGGGGGQQEPPPASGGSSSGGGGAGYTPGLGGGGTPSGTDGTTESAGTGVGSHGGYEAGNGGGFGAAGVSKTTAGGAAGNAVDGVSYVTFSTAGTRAGPEIN